MSFFDYMQNNSGGLFVIDMERGIGRVVIIEAGSAAEADRRAESVGLYFDGDGDCPCCGNRWCCAEAKGDEEPNHYGDPIAPLGDAEPGTWLGIRNTAFVHYSDGRVVEMALPNKWGF